MSSPAMPSPIAALRRFGRPAPAQERCELCSTAIPHEHQHLLEPASRNLLCACEACAILFGGSQDLKYRRVPRTIEVRPDFALSDMQWEGLGVPIALAFFFHSTPAGQVISMYPSPAGATESLLGQDAWQGIVEDNPWLSGLEPDVEALLVNRVRGTRDYYRAPIDECFKLVGLVRTHWRGLSGGAEVWKHLDAFFAGLKSRASTVNSNA